MGTISLLALFSLQYLQFSHAAATCYWPDGTVIANQIPYSPCNTTDHGVESACCELSTAGCTKGGYCAGAAGFYYRGGCTDPTWKSPNCPSLCSNVDTNNWVNVYSCVAGGFSSEWCCGSRDTTNCCNNTFGFNPGFVFTASSVQTSGGTPTETMGVTQTETVVVTHKEMVPVSHTETIGVGIGVGSGMALIVLGFLYLYFKERRRRLTAETAPPLPSPVRDSIPMADSKFIESYSYKPKMAHELHDPWSGRVELEATAHSR